MAAQFCWQPSCFSFWQSWIYSMWSGEWLVAFIILMQFLRVLPEETSKGRATPWCFLLWDCKTPKPFLFFFLLCWAINLQNSSSSLLRPFYFFSSRINPCLVFKVRLCPSHFPFLHCQLKFEIFLFTGFHRFSFLYSVGFPIGSNNVWKHPI